jgi:hypothetical protein
MHDPRRTARHLALALLLPLAVPHSARAQEGGKLTLPAAEGEGR